MVGNCTKKRFNWEKMLLQILTIFLGVRYLNKILKELICTLAGCFKEGPNWAGPACRDILLAPWLYVT